ncbi:MAG: S9 family peptidase [Chitinophagaceae bacterium]
MNRILYPFFALLFIQDAAMAQAPKRNLQPTDVYRMKTTGGGEISPDGNWVLYTITTVDSAKDRRNTDLWMISWDGKQEVQLTFTPEGEGNPRWSPDGKYISFTASRSGSNQIYLLNRLGGEAKQLTNVKGELSGYEWSPDGKRIAISMRDALDSTEKKGNKPYVIDRYHFKQDVVGYLYDKRKTHLYLFDVESKKIDTLTRGNYDERGFRWSPDGSRIAYVSNVTEDPDKNSNTDLFVIEAKAGASPKKLTDWKGSDDSPEWSPDSKRIAYLRSTADANYLMYDQDILSVISADGGAPLLLSANVDRPVGNHKWFKDGKRIAAVVSDDAESYIVSFDVSTGQMTMLIGGSRVFSLRQLHPNGSWLASMSEPHLPSELYALEDGALRRITTVQDEWVKQLSLASVEKFVSKSKDGAMVSNLLYLPIGGVKEKLPVIFFIHGGPVAQDEFSFDMTRQMLAARGYAVVAVNYRGSSGRGLAFCKAIYADWGNKEVLDIQGAADALIAKGIADPARMGIGGWSYGGILPDFTIAKDARFKAAPSGAGSAMQLSLYGVDQYILQLDNEIGPPWKDKNYEKYLKLSYPFLQAEKIKTPTLFMTGEKDFNVPAIGSEQMYQALRSNGVPTQLIVYPGQFHGISVPSFIRDRWERYINWFDQYLK